MYTKGDIVIIRFPFTDLSSSRKRPALIVSNDIVNKTGDYLLVQITSKVRTDALSLYIDKTNFTDNKALPLDSCIRLHKLFLLNQSLILEKATSIKKEFLEKVVGEIIKLIK